MSANSVPRFLEKNRLWGIKVTQVNTAVDGTGSFDRLVTAPEDGMRVDLFTLRAAEGVTANTVRIFLTTPGNTSILYEEIVVTATTAPVAGTEAWSAELVPTVLLNLDKDWKIDIALHKADTINVFAHGGEY